MCAIGGILHFHNTPIHVPWLQQMAQTLSHRGPDDEGMVLFGPKVSNSQFFSLSKVPPSSPSCWAGFIHQRLSILDLSPQGRQPMSLNNGHLWITYNGEIFNYAELRDELTQCGREFHTSTDTEVILHAYDEWGIDCQHRFNGMWAFALLDWKRRQLFLSRDRFGIKPLYWCTHNHHFAFASEPKALLHLPWVSREPNQHAIADYLIHSREDCFEWTFFQSIQRLLPGHYMLLPFASPSSYQSKPWWFLEETLTPPPATDAEAAEQFRDLFDSAVHLRLRSDVPVGTCLSGGLDSSAVVCSALPHLKPENQNTFSAVYEASFEEDETRFIEAVINHTGLNNYRCYPSGETLLQELEQFIYLQDEPFGSTSQYAQYKVFEIVRQHGTVVTLDGQGADEELAGYHYFYPLYLAECLQKGHLPTLWHEYRSFRQNTTMTWPQAVLSLLAGFLSHRSTIRWANRYDKSRNVDWVRNPIHRTAKEIATPPPPHLDGRLNRRLYEIFAVSGLPALLRYEDRNSMASGVEARLPFMDHRLVSYLFSLPAHFKIRHGTTKYIMRQALSDLLPPEILARKDKIGFATPEAQWFRESVFPYMHDLFQSRQVKDRGLYHPQKLMDFLHQNKEGSVYAGRALWRALNLELWFRLFLD